MFKLGLACLRLRLRTVPLRQSRSLLLIRPIRPSLRRTASFFPWSTSASPSPPSLDTAAEIAALEARANANPNDIPKQLAFFNALIATRTKEGYDTVIDRWEHTAERVSPVFSHYRHAHRFPRTLPPYSSAPTTPLRYISTHSPAPDANHP